MVANRARAPTGRSTTSGCRKPCDEIVDKQIEYGVDIVNDGEYAKAGSYGGYIQERVEGYSTRAGRSKPEAEARGHGRARPSALPRVLCLRPVVRRLRRTGSPWLRHARRGARRSISVKRAPAPDRSSTPARRKVADDVKNPQGRAPGQGRRGLYRGARSAQPRRRRATTSTTRAKRST